MGRKWNPLRLRIDSVTLSLSELFLGAFGFTVALFLLPTICIYYVVFLAVKTFLMHLMHGDGNLLMRFYYSNSCVFRLCSWNSCSSLSSNCLIPWKSWLLSWFSQIRNGFPMRLIWIQLVRNLVQGQLSFDMKFGHKLLHADSTKFLPSVRYFWRLFLKLWKVESLRSELL